MNTLNNIVPDLFDAAVTEEKLGVPAVSHPPRILMLYGCVPTVAWPPRKQLVC